MKYAVMVLLLLTATSCRNTDRFLEEQRYFANQRFKKMYKFDSSTSENYAVDVDILWVIDNSGSMNDYQQAVIRNSEEFIRQFTANSRLHWRMGLVSTSYREAPYLGFDTILDWQSTDVVSKFNAAVNRLGTRGDGLAERTFDPVEKVLRYYPGWQRPGAYFVVISVTDELEQSNMSVEEYLQIISRQMGGDIAKYFHYGVYGPDSNDSSNQKNFDVVKRTNGKMYNIGSPDYGVLLADLGKDLVLKTTAVHPIIVLDQRPKMGTIQVVYKGRVLIAGREWTYNPQYNFVQIQDPRIIDNTVLDVEVSFEVE